MLLFAVIALKFVSQKEDGIAQDEAIVENLASDLKINSALDSLLDSDVRANDKGEKR